MSKDGSCCYEKFLHSCNPGLAKTSLRLFLNSGHIKQEAGALHVTSNTGQHSNPLFEFSPSPTSQCKRSEMQITQPTAIQKRNKAIIPNFLLPCFTIISWAVSCWSSSSPFPSCYSQVCEQQQCQVCGRVPA